MWSLFYVASLLFQFHFTVSDVTLPRNLSLIIKIIQFPVPLVTAIAMFVRPHILNLRMVFRHLWLRPGYCGGDDNAFKIYKSCMGIV